MSGEKSPNWWQRLKLKGGHDVQPLAPLEEEHEGEVPAPAAPEEGEPAKRSRWFKSHDLARQIDQYAEDIGHVRSLLQETLNRLSHHIKTQQPIAEQMAQSLKPLPALLEHEARSLEQIRGQLDRITESNEQLAAALEALPKSAREQYEKLALIEDQLEEYGRTDRAAFEGMDSLGRNVAALVRLSEVQQQTLEELTARSREQLDLLKQHLERRDKANTINRVMLVLLVALVVLAGAALVFTIAPQLLP